MRLRLIINYTEVAAAKSGYWQCGTVLWRFDYPIQKSLSSTIYTKLDELTVDKRPEIVIFHGLQAFAREKDSMPPFHFPSNVFVISNNAAGRCALGGSLGGTSILDAAGRYTLRGSPGRGGT